jgi:hypothetical protein
MNLIFGRKLFKLRWHSKESPPRRFLEKFGPATDAGATNFCAIIQTHSGLQCPELAQFRPQIVPWSTLCRSNWVRNDPVLTTRGWLLRQRRWCNIAVLE